MPRPVLGKEKKMNKENQEQKAYREQYFSEMNDQDKIKFLAKELQRTQRELASMSQVVHRLIEHKHCDGAIVYELRNNYGLDMCQGFRVCDNWY
jgi:benzoyl-CoA reductase/2-hydroxyglutaryl-CoA dehydratase subunit BcrC/BadD/HgdB